VIFFSVLDTGIIMLVVFILFKKGRSYLLSYSFSETEMGILILRFVISVVLGQ